MPADPTSQEARRPRRASGHITLKQLAERLGVTKVTVSRALNHPHLVSPETLRRVQEAVRETGYIPNLVAGSLASNRSHLVVALVPNIGGTVFQETMEAMTATLRQRGYQLLIGQSSYDEAQEEPLIEEVLGRRPAGVVLTGVLHSGKTRQLLQASEIPVVETWDLTPQPIDMLVGFSHDAVGRAAAEYLCQAGTRPVAVITPDDRRAMTRAHAFRDAVRRLADMEVPILPVAAPTRLGDGRRALQELLARQPDLGAVFCAADSLALGVLIEARSRAIRVPEQLRVLGYGDLAFAVDTDPPLSTVRIDGSRIGALAASMLMDRIEGKAVAQPVVDVGFQLIERAST
ncbi:transcriptional regulator, LacI family [Noviherbaspirillum humi]|uniref:Transcriptional regulator, LacI family n=1 Tax=Noviherbaspirillum humi TaxID=1688639 RepID=A0A239EY20_9BURK|nr:transcriptional regulator, LacI family [Noviherbaspirillum humi]